MSDQKLVFVPSIPETAPPPHEIIERALRDIGLIGESTDYFADTHYRPGSRFHDLIIFERSHHVVHLGQGPRGLEPEGVSDNRTLCTVELPAATPDVQWLGGAHVADPSCRACGHGLNQWGDMLGDWFDDQANYRWSCPACHHQSRPWELDWRETCGFGRYSVDIWHVSYGEARPHSELLEVLRATTGVPWGYFYYHL